MRYKAKKHKKVIPTKKQRKFVEGLVEGKSMYQAAVDANYSEKTANNAGRDIRDLPGTQTLIKNLREALELEGITPQYLAEKIKAGIDRAVYDHKDLSARHKYIETAIKVRGEIIDKSDVSFTVEVVNYAEQKDNSTEQL